MIKNKNKKTVTDNDSVEGNDSNNVINKSPHAPNSSTASDTENKTSMRQLTDGQEYPVTKGDIINK